MSEDGRSRMRAWFDGEIAARRSADMRYGEQVFEIGVELGDLDLKAPEALARLKRSFEARHEELYAYHLPEQQPVLVNARVATVGVLPELPSEPAVAAQDRKSVVEGKSVAGRVDL